MNRLIVLVFMLNATLQITPHELQLTETKLSAEVTTDYSKDTNDNLYEIIMDHPAVLEDKHLFIIVESENPGFVLSILDRDRSHTKKSSVLIDVSTFTGNIALVMSDTYFNSQLDFFKESSKLRFMVRNSLTSGNTNYKVKVLIAKKGVLELGRIYTTRVDYMISDLSVDLVYDGTKYEDLQKLRFQLTAVKTKSDYALSASLQHKNDSYLLNTVFKKSVGGILTAPKLPVCKTSNCVYTLKIHIEKVKTLNIESFLISEIEKLSINHYDDYYDRVYDNNVVTKYELVYDSAMQGMDISVCLIPVTGTSGLYINPVTVPNDLNRYAWKEEGQLAKRITIKWDELTQMRADKSNLIIAVHSDKPGEFLLRIDAHEPGFKGKLTSGIVEAGYVKEKDMNNYLYQFEVYETQTISFNVKMVIFSGESNLYLMHCESFKECKISDKDISDSNTMSVENNHSTKTIKYSFKCVKQRNSQSTICQFAIAVKGNENHGTHYDISLQEDKFHRLMTPGHAINLNLNADEIVHLKFSYPKTQSGTKLFLSIEPIWGAFSISMSKKEEYPAINGAKFKEEFSTARIGLYNATKTIQITNKVIDDYTIQGLYYIGVNALTSCALNIKFFEKADNELTLHTLTAGNQARSEVTSADEIVYFIIKLSLADEQSSSVTVSLTPLKGSYTIYANKNGKLPNTASHDLISDTHDLELNTSDLKTSSDECIIGVKLNSKQVSSGERYQFLISFSYSSKPQLLHPGVLSTHTIKDANYFLIEITKEMSDLLVIKTIVDGFNIDMCGKFTSNESADDHKSCDYSAKGRQVGFYLTEKELTASCSDKWSRNKCFLQLSVSGNANQKYSVGYTYNDHPFQLIKDQAVQGPVVTKGNFSLNYIYHVEPEQPVGVYFNTKGHNVEVYTKLVNGDEFNEKMAVTFPHMSNHDINNISKVGHISNVYYAANDVAAFGKSPELLISIKTSTTHDAIEPFDFNYAFVLQSSLEGREILRSQTHTQLLQEEEWNYYTFYNNGSSGSIRIYVSSQVATKLEVGLSRNKTSRPPFTNKPLVRKNGLGSVEMEIKLHDLGVSDSASSNELKGYYTLSVKSSLSCFVNIFWNNKDEFDYVEITPNEPNSMILTNDRELYFTTYVKGTGSTKEQDKASIAFYIKSNIEAELYLLKSSSGEFEAPSAKNYHWKNSISKVGGVSVMEIQPSDPDYCTDCTYFGFIDATQSGEVTLLVDIEHDDIPISLVPGLSFPFHIEGLSTKMYRVYNPDNGLIGITLSMLSGQVNLYLSASPTVSPSLYTEFFPLETGLDVHKFITINPTVYDIVTAHDYYILVVSNSHDPASFVLSVSKNQDHTPIDLGITKYVNLAPTESVNYFYKPQKNEKSFEVKFQLRQIVDEKYKKQALDKINEYVSVYVMSDNGDKHQIKYKSKDAHKESLHMEFDIPDGSDSTFSINISNPIRSAITSTIELTHAGYKLVHLNEFSTENPKGTEPLIYEIYGAANQYLFVDIRMCTGNISASFYQSHFDNLTNGESSEYESMKRVDSLTYYLKMETNKMLLKIENKDTENSIYELNIYNEIGLNRNPYEEIKQGESGKIDVETDRHIIKIPRVVLRSKYMEGFQHKIKYKAYVTDSHKVMKYLKNCGTSMISRAFEDPHIISFSKVESYGSNDRFESKGKIEIPYSGLKTNTKYYGVVIATIELYPIEGGHITPSRNIRVYYDEYIIMTPRIALPINLIVGLIVSLGVLACLFWIVRSYVFGEINKMHGLEKLTNFEDLDSGVLGPNLVSILEQEYYEGKSDSKRDRGDAEHDLDSQLTGDDSRDLYELTDRGDRTRPLA